MEGESTNEELASQRWGYVILFSKFMILFFDAGITKSFGVLIPLMVDRLGESYATVGLICSLPTTFFSLVGKYSEFCPLLEGK